MKLLKRIWKDKMECVILRSNFYARMAELVDAADSKSAVRKDVQVRFLFRALGYQETIKAHVNGLL